MTYLRTNYPYLYDLEMKVRKVQEATGFGTVSISLEIIQNKVEGMSFFDEEKKKYRFRKDNILE